MLDSGPGFTSHDSAAHMMGPPPHPDGTTPLSRLPPTGTVYQGAGTAVGLLRTMVGRRYPELGSQEVMAAGSALGKGPVVLFVPCEVRLGFFGGAAHGMYVVVLNCAGELALVPCGVGLWGLTVYALTWAQRLLPLLPHVAHTHIGALCPVPALITQPRAPTHAHR